PLAWLWLHRLVATEYDRRGWDALALFPLAPAQALAVKLALTGGVLVTLLAGAWAVALATTLALGSPPDEAAATGALRQGLAFLAVWTCYLAAAGALGRHRLAAHGLALAGLAGASAAGVPPSSLPGLA